MGPTQTPVPALPPQNSSKQHLVHTVKVVSSIVVTIVVVTGIALLVSFMFTHKASTGKGKLQPTPVDGSQCDVSTNYAQVALAGGATCDDVAAIIPEATKANGSDYKVDGYSCTGTKQGSNTQWASYWDGTFYSYSCAAGSKQVAFNWQSASAQTENPSSSNPSSSNPSSSTTTVTIGGPGALQPTLPGDGECGASTNYAQIAIGGGADCTTAETVIQSADGSNFTADSYSCQANQEGANTQWSSYWSGTFYAYTCADGSKQIAFTWQSPTATAQ